VPAADPPTVGGRGPLGGLSDARRGALIYVAASLVFICTDSLAKVIVADVPILAVVFGRNLAYVVAVVVLLGGGSPRRLLHTARPWPQATRGLIMFASTALYFWALSVLPLAEVSTLSSTAPLITVALAGPVLGERVSRPAVIGAVMGFLGVVTMIGLDPAHLQPAMVLPLANAAILAVFYLLTRDLRDEPASVTMFWSGIVPLAASALLFTAVPSERAPTTTEWLAIAGVGVLALTAHRLLVGAYRWGRASDLAPMGYLGVLWAFLVGALVFSEPITLQSVVGAAAIVAGGIIALREPSADRAGTAGSAEYAVPVVDADEAGPFAVASADDQPMSPAR
jgi:drug/metabolite transporter (DMT)-like permease